MKKPLLLIGILAGIVIVLLLVRITLVNSISTTGLTLVSLQNQIESYKNENELLTEKYLQQASYTAISEKAKKIGYVPVKSEIDLSSPLPLALR